MTSKAKVLLVDDHESVQQLLEAILKVQNFDVVYSSSGKEGLDKAQTESPDLIILDVMMPGMDGFEVCQALKNIEDTKDIPVIFLTARGEENDREMGRRVGGAGYIKKPFRSVELIEMIDGLLGEGQ